MEVLRTGLVKKNILETEVSQKVFFGRGGGLRHGSGQRGGGLYRGTYMYWTYMRVPPPPGVMQYVEDIIYTPPPPPTIHGSIDAVADTSTFFIEN